LPRPAQAHQRGVALQPDADRADRRPIDGDAGLDVDFVVLLPIGLDQAVVVGRVVLDRDLVDLPVVEERGPAGDVGADEGIGRVAFAGGDRGDPRPSEADGEDQESGYQRDHKLAVAFPADRAEHAEHGEPHRSVWS
jgi:hypothetical protein